MRGIRLSAMRFTQSLELSEPGQQVPDLIELIRSQADPQAMIENVLHVPDTLSKIMSCVK